MATNGQKIAPRGLEVVIEFIGPGSPSVRLRNGWGREWTATAPTQPQERLPRRFILKQPTCRCGERIQMSFKFNRFNFWVPESQPTWLCKSLQSDLASTLPHRLRSIFRDCRQSCTSESSVPAPMGRHRLDGPALEAGTKKYPLPRKLSGQRDEKDQTSIRTYRRSWPQP